MGRSWVDIALNLSKEISLEHLHPEACACLAKLDKPFGIACSGGVDSVALLLLIFAHFKKHKTRLYVFHYNHKLRGEDSEKDEAFVRKLSGALGVKFVVDANVAPDPDANEESLRTLRHRFYDFALDQIGGNTVLIAHHAEDVAETILMRLARGSGTYGLCAPRPVKEFTATGKVYVRPLLNLSKAFLIDKLNAAGATWREDSSNASDQYLRNRIRRRVYPAWQKAVHGDLLVGVLRSRKLLEEDSDALDQWLESSVGDIQSDRCDLRNLKGKPKALYRRALRKFVEDKLSAKAFDEFLEAIFNDKEYKVSAGGDEFISYKNGVIFKEKHTSPESWGPFVLKAGGVLELPEGGVLSCEKVSMEAGLLKEVLGGKISPEKEVYLDIEDEFEVRSWQEGDRYKPLGAPGTRKLSDLFTDKKVEQIKRSLLPVIISRKTGEIVWVPGLPPSENCKISLNIQSALRLTYKA